MCGAAALAIHIAPADAQQVQAGTLECRGGPDAGFILGPFTNLDCVLHVDGAPDSRYVAAVRDLNVFIGDQDVALSWKVMAPVPWLGPGDLAGGYTHDAGAGANVLAGGTSAAITLRPLNEQADPSPPPVKVENLEIRPADH
ncbi:DUF992 domain-containing protein [Bradyrhizobium sp. Ce-3]|uniref:DUF992 domain-containing protein n=1 Tax=Bradyrhizobium sp. Ce-3 TaxID=2913970 RepID=UPI001FBAC310|nr:DUF992 domain-containing protein [Bradyrhizobium sp. Ce-3]